MLVRLAVIRPSEIDENMAWSGKHHRPPVAGCMVRDWLDQLNEVKWIEFHWVDLVEHEADLEVDPVLGDLAVVHGHLLLLHPGAADVVNGLACLRDSGVDCVLEAFVRGRVISITFATDIWLSLGSSVGGPMGPSTPP